MISKVWTSRQLPSPLDRSSKRTAGVRSNPTGLHVGNSRNVYTARHLCTFSELPPMHVFLFPCVVPIVCRQWKRLPETEPSTYPPIHPTLTLHLISFGASHQDSTRDLRFTYCACAISSFLGDWSGIDRAKTVEYIAQCFVSHSVFIMFPAGSLRPIHPSNDPLHSVHAKTIARRDYLPKLVILEL